MPLRAGRHRDRGPPILTAWQRGNMNAGLDPLQDAESGAPITAPSLAPVALMGTHVLMLNPTQAITHRAAGDIDLAVEGLDELWPLRLPPDWRLCQVLHYDARGWYWVLDHEGQTFAFDTIDDPLGLGRDGVPTERLIKLARTYPDAAAAAYLTAKRIRKSSVDPIEWDRIRKLARPVWDPYGHALSWIFGGRMAELLRRAVSERPTPPASLREAARTMQWLRRRRSPAYLLASFAASAQRWYGRLTHPSGLYVVIAGPDGTGKTTMAEALPAICAGPFRRSMHLHWRPGLLPRAGSLIGSPETDSTRPHSRTPHGTVGSLASLAYHWLDFFVGGWVRFVPFRMRSGLIVLERGWLDMAVDPRRYRIALPSQLVKTLGRMLIQPDLAIVLEAPPAVAAERKPEIDGMELERQARTWRSVIPSRITRVYIDASAPAEAVLASAREAVLSFMSERAVARLGHGWAGLPTRSQPRWSLPRGPRGSALAAMSIYQPMTVRGQVGWEIGRALARIGAFRLLPRANGPPSSVRDAVAPFMPARSTLAVMRSNHPGRFVALIVRADGSLHAVAKIASDRGGRTALEAEARNIERFEPFLESPLRAPRILAHSPGILLLEAAKWTARARPWELSIEVAFAIGQAYARSSNSVAGTGMAHGDFAPWNLLMTQDGWVIVDWEDAWPDAPPFYDISHYLVQAHLLLGKPSLEDLTGRDSPSPHVRALIDAYAAGAHLPADAWRRHLALYLRTSVERADPSLHDYEQVVVARRQLLSQLAGQSGRSGWANSRSTCSDASEDV